MRCFPVVAAAAAVLLSACQLTPPNQPVATCKIPKQVLRTPQPDEPEGAGLGSEAAFEGALRGLLEPGAKVPNANPTGFGESERPPNLLFLSGGSQKGAFGAGFLKGWSDPPAPMPEFDLVTGVSAGAILSTAAFIGDGQGAADQFAKIDRESRVLKPFAKRGSNGEFGLQSYVSIAKHGAAADLAPMRAMLVDYLSSRRFEGGPRVIDEVAARADAGKKLFVGAADLDSGEFVAFDLSAYVQGKQPDQIGGQTIDCYADAIVASASVPLAALPVFIDGRLYVDGGARNGMFGWQLSKQLSEVALAGGTEAKSAPKLYLLVNGTQEMDPDCKPYKAAGIAPAGPSAEQDRFCSKVVGDATVTPPKRPKWSLATVGMRSVDVLVNQVYRANAQSIFLNYQLAYRGTDSFHFARMRSDAPDFVYQGRSCGSSAGRVPKDGVESWYRLDEEAYHPLEFYPRYMQCLQAYGAQRARDEGW
jgi:predicted acylesterase/phospholipase RssA